MYYNCLSPMQQAIISPLWTYSRCRLLFVSYRKGDYDVLGSHGRWRGEYLLPPDGAAEGNQSAAAAFEEGAAPLRFPG